MNMSLMAAFDVFSGPVTPNEAVEQLEELLFKVVYSSETSQFEDDSEKFDHLDGATLAYALADAVGKAYEEGSVVLVHGDEAEELYRESWIKHFMAGSKANREYAEESLCYDIDFRKFLVPKRLIVRMAQAVADYQLQQGRALARYMEAHPELGG